MSDVGIPLYIGIHHAWDMCTSPTPHKPTSKGGETKMMPQENNGSAGHPTTYQQDLPGVD